MHKNMKNLLKISLIVSLIGIFLLLFLANILTPELTTIDQITNKYINKNIKVQGQISNIQSYNESNFQIISINDSTGKINVITDKIINLSKNQKISVIGTVKEYKKFLQIQANKIII